MPPSHFVPGAERRPDFAAFSLALPLTDISISPPSLAPLCLVSSRYRHVFPACFWLESGSLPSFAGSIAGDFGVFSLIRSYRVRGHHRGGVAQPFGAAAGSIPLGIPMMQFARAAPKFTAARPHALRCPGAPSLRSR